jgi:hypothetical protein
MLLTKAFTHNGQTIEISVYYAPLTNTVTEIKSTWIHSMGGKLPVTGVMMKLFETQINKLIDGVDWREIHRAALDGDCFGEETNGVNMNNIHPIISIALARHINS